MHFHYTPYALFLFAAAVIAAVLGWHAWRRRSFPGAVAFFVVTMSACLWSLAGALEMLAAGLGAKLFWANIEYLSIAAIPVAWLIMTIHATGHARWLTWRRIVALGIVPLTTVALVWTNNYHHLMRTVVWLDERGAFPVVGRVLGPWFWIHTAYSYLMLAVAFYLLVRAVKSSPPLFRGQPLVLLGGLCVALAWNATYVLVPGALPNQDYTPAIFGLTGVIVAWGLFRFRLFTLVPVARAALVENMSDGLLVMDEGDRVLDLNEAARRIIGRASRDIVAKPLAETWPAWPKLNGRRASHSLPTEVTAAEGPDRRDYEVRVSPLSERGQSLGRMIVLHDITQRKIMEESLRKQALGDALTGLPNRVLFMSKLDDAVRRARRKKGDLFAVAILDLDRFKLINDSIGHAAGDFFLQKVAEKLLRCVREVDTVARMGGDEFMILVNDVQSARDVIQVVDRIQDELQSPVRFRRQDIASSASLGLVMWNDTFDGPEDLLRAADTAMYQAKEAGRACYRIFDDDMHKAVLRTMRAETDLRTAIKQGAFAMVYQPIVDLKTGGVSSLEALIRWSHPTRGTVMPGDFITIAENSGLIVPLGTLILDEVCGQLSRWRSLGDAAPDASISMNISPRQLTETDFVEVMLDKMREWQVAPDKLILEITETAIIRDPLKSKRVMEQLRDEGIRLCLDDFGTGWASLRHLSTFPVQEIKIDRSFVSKILPGNTEFEIVRSLTALAHTLGLAVTGEGVEHSDQLGLLHDVGCDNAQGYFVGHPMPPEAVTEYLEHYRQEVFAPFDSSVNHGARAVHPPRLAHEIRVAAGRGAPGASGPGGLPVDDQPAGSDLTRGLPVPRLLPNT